MLLKKQACFPLQGGEKTAFNSREALLLVIAYHFFVGLYKQAVKQSYMAKPV